MKRDMSIIVFGYAFPHKKTYDFLNILNNEGFKSISVIAAPKIKLKSNSNIDNKESNTHNVKNLCDSLDLNYFECQHNDIQKIKEIKNKYNADLAIISGARIIKAEIIELFDEGIINFHPGKIPETSGLDSFYYSIKNNCSMGITVHFIDKRVDAGKFILFEEIKIEINDTTEGLRKKIYASQLNALNRFLKNYLHKENNFKEIDRPYKNLPLSLSEKENVLLDFNEWKENQINIQNAIELDFFSCCKLGKIDRVMHILNKNAYLLNQHNPEGWSAIIIASFWQNIEIVSYLLKLGAKPNDQGVNGTTVLMYAKTKIVDDSDPDMSLLKLLINNGAKINKKDNYGKDIFYYLQKFDTESTNLIIEFLKKIAINNGEIKYE